MPLRVLVADDAADIVEIVAFGARMSWPGCQVAIAANGQDALRCFQQERPDIVVLDVSMPPPDGFEVCRRIREASSVPILMLSVRGATLDKVRALDYGADDYVIKPFSYSELLCRVRALLRRADKRSLRGIVRVGDLTIDPLTRSVRLDGKPVHLSAKEFGLLHALAGDPTRVFGKAELLKDVWGYLSIGNTRTLDAHACRLRKKLAATSARPFVVNVRGIGYRLTEAL